MSFFQAKRMFQENLNRFVNPHAEPEKYNLYIGLENLASGLEDLEDKINELQEQIRFIKANLD